jgi:hypothetical protein
METKMSETQNRVKIKALIFLMELAGGTQK